VTTTAAAQEKASVEREEAARVRAEQQVRTVERLIEAP
jgi:hypothetical protein